MAEKRKGLKTVSYIMTGGEPVRFESLAPEKRAGYAEKMAENTGRTLSAYLSSRPEEAAPLFREK